MSEGLNQQERYDYMAMLLRKHHNAITYMSEDYMRDFVGMIHSFLNTDKRI